MSSRALVLARCATATATIYSPITIHPVSSGAI